MHGVLSKLVFFSESQVTFRESCIQA